MEITSPWLQYAFFAVGAAMYVLVMVDVFVTTISMHGGGPVTNAILGLAHAAFSGPPDKDDGEFERRRPVRAFLASYSNLLLTLTLFVTWVSLLLVGLTLMMYVTPEAIERSGGAGVASIWERLYFAGASITTAGFGDYVPGNTTWQFYTVLMATSGLVVSSLGIAYVINIVGAGIQQRVCARYIFGCGATPRMLLAAGWDGEGFGGLDTVLANVTAQLLTHTKNHLAYPMVHYVRSDSQRDSLPSRVAVLDEALTILLLEVPARHHPARSVLVGARNAVTAYLESIDAIYLSDDIADAAAPPWPRVGFLREYWGIEPLDRRATLNRDERGGLARRRKLLLAAVESQGRTWRRAVGEVEPATRCLDVDLFSAAYDLPRSGQRELREVARGERAAADVRPA